jgi:hypothetical protein
MEFLGIVGEGRGLVLVCVVCGWVWAESAEIG